MRNTSSNSDTHPYRRLKFWMNTSNHFWETPMYTEKAKEYFRNSVKEMHDRESRYTSLQ